MRLLLDTNALLWLLDDDPRLGVKARKALSQASEIVISEVSLWEIAIKVSIGKLQPIPDLYETVLHLGFGRLGLIDRYLEAYTELPMLHRDPFDRMLVVQAQLGNLKLVTSDAILHGYDVAIVRADV